MPALQRSTSLRGARFFRDGKLVMFVHHLDSSTRDGPRKATDADKKAHPDAWAAHEADVAADPWTKPERAAAEA